jgi:hypothetical protein
MFCLSWFSFASTDQFSVLNICNSQECIDVRSDNDTNVLVISQNRCPKRLACYQQLQQLVKRELVLMLAGKAKEPKNTVILTSLVKRKAEKT